MGEKHPTSCLLHTPHWGCARNQGNALDRNRISPQANGLSSETPTSYGLSRTTIPRTLPGPDGDGGASRAHNAASCYRQKGARGLCEDDGRRSSLGRPHQPSAPSGLQPCLSLHPHTPPGAPRRRGDQGLDWLHIEGFVKAQF
uniref:Uncharacterized protein n=1 Tax=Pipistrellus kuhlii TaxID=59472 RepID=A0A7J7W2Z4_PIPKU|nr:hypothetical protein mPipKuh1_008146 [Pipistrellus kuhlii]